MKQTRWLLVELMGIIGMFCILFYVIFIFMIGVTPSALPQSIIMSVSMRNLIISGTHTVGYVFLIGYLISYILSIYVEKLTKATAIVNIVLFTLCMVLVWQCYLLGEVEPLIFVITLYGIMMAVFMLAISYTIYDLMACERYGVISSGVVYKILAFGSILFDIAAVVIYYKYVTDFLYLQFGIIVKSRMIDALALFCYMVAIVMRMTALGVGCFLDRKWMKQIEDESKEN